MNNKVKKILPVLVVSVLTACNGGAGSSSSPTPTPVPTPTPTPAGSNTVSITAGSGFNGKGVNVPYITVTVCQPGTTNCITIDHILLDSGSTGFKLNKSQLSGFTLPSINTTNNEPIFMCYGYGAGYIFGSANYADVQIAGENASNIPVQIINDGDQSSVPSACSNGNNFADLADSGAKGIIGINPNIALENSTTDDYVYSNGSYQQISDLNTIPTTLNVNPVTSFESDNNGAIFSFPSVPNPSNANINGTLTFGISTRSNNTLPNNLTTVLGDPQDEDSMFEISDSGNTYPAMFDGGTPDYSFINNSSLPVNGDNFYTVSSYTWQTSISSYNSVTPSYPLSTIISGTTLPGNGYILIPELAQAMLFLNNIEIYGLPFFFGKTIYITNRNSTTSMGSGPAWGYVTN